MAYLANKPQANDNLDVSQGDIQGNFQTANTVMGINHFPFDDVTANQGKHKFFEVVERLVIPGGLANGEETIYAKATTGQGELYFTRGATGVEFQLTGGPNSTASFGNYTNYTPPVANQNGGWTFLPGGLMLQYGSMRSTGGTTTIAFPIAFTDVLAPYSITISRVQGGVSNTAIIGVNTITQTDFIFSSSASNATILYWMAIGK